MEDSSDGVKDYYLLNSTELNFKGFPLSHLLSETTTMDFFVGSITDVIKCLVPPVLRHICYVVNASKYLDQLRRPMEDLTAKRTDVQRSVDAAGRRGEVIKKQVENWFEKVINLQTEVTSLHDAIQGNRGCLRGSCSVRYRVGKESYEKIKLINELRSEGSFPAVSDPAPPLGIEDMPTPDFESFQTTKIALGEIMRALQDDMISLVGVYGMAGVGKTTIVTEVGKLVKRDGFFDQVVMVTVSQHPIVKKIQADIAEDLQLSLGGESELVRARRLLQRLTNGERILVILDDLWAPLELANTGVPFGDDSNKQCKVLLTTRSLEVCDQMTTQVNVEVGVLTEPDDWSLFRKNTGDRVDSPELQTVAKEVARECRGLPIALVTLGRALRNKDPTVWADAACQLKKSAATNIAGMNAKVFSSIRLSYDYLDHDQAKVCFLLCCLFPEDYEISEHALLPYVIGEPVFRAVESLKEARIRLHAVLDRLQALCLLLEAEDGCVKMHDLVRDVAIEIAREDHGFDVKAGRGLEQWPDMENPESCKRLSLMQNEIIKLPESSDCSQLVSLSLYQNQLLREVPDRFFERMTLLTTLDLSFTRICSLPQSISCLKNLLVLFLEDCDLRNLPKEIGGLTKLKWLNLSGNGLLEIPPDVFSQFFRLEELEMRHSFDKWEVEGSEDRSKAYFSEVASLTGLTNLILGISNVKCLSAHVPNRWKKLTRFSIVVGEGFCLSITEFEPAHDTHMCFSYIAMPEELSGLFKMLLGRTEKMYFYQCEELMNLLLTDNSLKDLKLESCDDLEYLFNAEKEKALQIAFNNLEVLKLYYLRNLKGISRGPLPNEYFDKLSSLRVEKCDTLQNSVFHSGLITRLPNLKDLYVSDCSGLKEIFNSESLEVEAALHDPLVKLRKLELWGLPNLETIWKGVVPHGSLHNIVDIKVHQIKRLRYLFSPTMVEGLQKLERLTIDDCAEMVQIISIDEEGKEQAENCETGEGKMTLPKLMILKLWDLPKLLGTVTFSSQGNLLLDVPALRTLNVDSCPNLESLSLDPENPSPIVIKGDWIGLEEIKKKKSKPLFQCDATWPFPSSLIFDRLIKGINPDPLCNAPACNSCTMQSSAACHIWGTVCWQKRRR